MNKLSKSKKITYSNQIREAFVKQLSDFVYWRRTEIMSLFDDVIKQINNFPQERKESSHK